jgi:hypothetical protein
MDIGGWLRSLGLERYEQTFRDNEISERVLPSLTQEDLKEIGVGPVGHRRIGSRSLVESPTSMTFFASCICRPLFERCTRQFL